jgi:hypothetical protein
MTTIQISITMLIINFVLLFTVVHSGQPSPIFIDMGIIGCLAGVILFIVAYMYLFIVQVFKEKKLREDLYSGKWNKDILSAWRVILFASLLLGFTNYNDIKGMSSIFRVKQYLSDFVFSFCILSLIFVSNLLIYYLGRFLAGSYLQSKSELKSG